VLLLKKKKYIPLPIYNSDDVVMSRENRNFHLRLFVKGGALQFGIRAVSSKDQLHSGIRAIRSEDR
jgi:hypothetical protein